MARTKGAKDLKKRKVRKDRRHKYVKRKGRFIPYVPKRSRSDPLKIWFWKVRPMTLDGISGWSKKLRLKVKKITYTPELRVDLDAARLANLDAVKETCLEVLGYTGEWLMMGFSRGRNRFHCKPVKLCRVVIRNSPNGLVAQIPNNYRLYRYWFWEKP